MYGSPRLTFDENSLPEFSEFHGADRRFGYIYQGLLLPLAMWFRERGARVLPTDLITTPELKAALDKTLFSYYVDILHINMEGYTNGIAVQLYIKDNPATVMILLPDMLNSIYQNRVDVPRILYKDIDEEDLESLVVNPIADCLNSRYILDSNHSRKFLIEENYETVQLENISSEKGHDLKRYIGSPQQWERLKDLFIKYLWFADMGGTRVRDGKGFTISINRLAGSLGGNIGGGIGNREIIDNISWYNTVYLRIPPNYEEDYIIVGLPWMPPQATKPYSIYYHGNIDQEDLDRVLNEIILQMQEYHDEFITMGEEFPAAFL